MPLVRHAPRDPALAGGVLQAPGRPGPRPPRGGFGFEDRSVEGRPAVFVDRRRRLAPFPVPRFPFPVPGSPPLLRQSSQLIQLDERRMTTGNRTQNELRTKNQERLPEESSAATGL